MSESYVTIGLGKDGKDGIVLLSYEDFSKYLRRFDSLKIDCFSRSQSGRIQKILAGSKHISSHVALNSIEKFLGELQKLNSENGYRKW
jgi:hypothetical protein